MILAGDVGGTKTVLALFEIFDGGLRETRTRTFSSRSYPSLEAIVEEFLAGSSARPAEAACFGVAGPIHDGNADTTNLPWHLESASLARAANIQRVTLVNDLQAAAYGMLRLPANEFTTLQSGSTSARGNCGVIAPGTGLGQALLFWDGARYHAIASEGGHADFTVRTEREFALLQHLRTDLGGHVSLERVLSGDGLHRIYGFLRESGRAEEPAWLREQLATGDPNAAIATNALSAADPQCVDALELFCAILAAEAGNLALRCVADSGIFIGGGIAPKILPALDAGAFTRAFIDKGRFSGWLATIPVRVALNQRAPLIGAAHVAAGDHT